MSIDFRSDMKVDLVKSDAADENVIWAARISTQGERADTEISEARKEGLIRYLVSNRHGSPLEHSSFTFRVEVPIFVAREVFRHRIASYNEWSGRYSEMLPSFYLPTRERPLQQVGKAAHYQMVPGTDDQFGIAAYAMENLYKASWETYQRLLQEGIAREVARNVLPLATYTTFYMTVNARALMNFLSLRTHEPDAANPSHPLYEIEQMARQMEAVFAEKMPYTYKAWNATGRVSP